MAEFVSDSTKSVTVTQADVTDADRAAVTAFHNIQAKRIIAGDKTLGDNRDVIEQAFARHRIEAERRAISAAPPAMDREAVAKVREAERICRYTADRATHMLDREDRRWQPTRAHYEGLRNALRNAESTLSTLSADAIRQGEGDLRNAIRNEVINTPETADFMAGVPLEAAHQRDRWGADHDAGKAPLDWFWLIGYLAQKAADAAMRGDSEKAKHHTISTAAALANWHAALSGADNRMRPGIATPASHASDGEGA